MPSKTQNVTPPLGEPDEQSFVILPGSFRPVKKGIGLSPAPLEDRLDVTISVRQRNQLPPVSTGDQLSRSEYSARYGADPQDISLIQGFVTGYGLKVDHVDLGRRGFWVSGTVGEFNRAFQTELKTYKSGESSYRTREGYLKVPKALVRIIESVDGLTDEPFAEPHLRSGTIRPHATASVPRGLTPIEVAHRYNFPTDPTGQGQVIGIIELGGGFRQEELNSYFAALGVNPPKVLIPQFHGCGENKPGSNALARDSADPEVLLDLEVIGSIAPGAQMAVYFAPDASGQSFIDAVTAAVNDSTLNPTIISISWGGPESNATEQFIQRLDQALQAAAHLGITVCVASGDNASADFDANDPRWDGGAHVDFPASSPFALACGGTQLVGGNGSNLGEIVWHSGPNDGTGGGVSRFFPLPDYQKDALVPAARNPPGRVGRGVPDVCGNAATESGYRILCDGQAFPDASRVPPIPPIGGTSAVAPLWAALIAVLNQKLGRQLGFVNPLLYQLLGSPAFHDITQGDNGDYQAISGWDPCTGLGSPDGQMLLKALSGDGQPSRRVQASVPLPPKGGIDDRMEILRQYFRVTEKLLAALSPEPGHLATISEDLRGGMASGEMGFGFRFVADRHTQFEDILRRLEQALVDAGYPTPFDQTSDAVGVTGSVGALVRIINQTFFRSSPRFTDGDLDNGDTIGDVALKILNLP